MLLEFAGIVYILAFKRLNIHLVDIVFLAIGGTIGLVVAVMWVFYAPQEKETLTDIQIDRGKTHPSSKSALQENPVPLKIAAQATMKNQETVPDANGMNSVLERKSPEKNMDMHEDDTIAINGQGRQFQNPPVLRSPAELRSPSLIVPFPFIVPKEGDDPALCADKCADHIQNGFYRYAVTDGASASFLPARWAQILAESFVHSDNDFNEHSAGIAWLRDCSQQWSQWVDKIWIPQLGRDKDWGRDKAQGAQATLIGCSFSYQLLQQTGMAKVDVVAVGDANFFLVHPLDENLNRCDCWSFPCTKPEDFGPVPNTLVTAEALIPQTQFMRHSFQVQRGDYLFLTTDALAQWMLSRIFHKDNPWQRLSRLSTYEDFHAFVVEERDKGELESDDTTMLKIYIS
ncbi:MAG TPA: hypothetical protein VKR42_01565 [Ktedonobacteraceae bacterium]|nr:hypothetical protein [Ktedonobacteraceae bacterium]